VLVEDDRDQVVLAMRALRKHGIVNHGDDAVFAEGGEEAIDHLLGDGSHEGGDTVLAPSSCSSTCIFPGWTVWRS
jgi:hypothetical protein